MIVAIVAALLAAAVLTTAVAYVIRPPDETGGRQAPQTVAALAPVVTSPTPTLSPTATEESEPSPTPRKMVTPRVIETFTPKPTVKPSPKPTRTPKATRTPEATAEALFAASGRDFADWNGENWFLSDGVLVNDGEAVVSRRWVDVPFEPPGGAYAIEAEIRVIGAASQHCEQSFGVVAGGEQGVVWGGGVIFGCDKVRRARITDVTDWEAGYNRHRVLDSEPFEPDGDWHRYRLEVDGVRVRLLIDGKLVLEAEDDEANGGGEDVSLGIWSHAVQLEVRWVGVFEV